MKCLFLLLLLSGCSYLEQYRYEPYGYRQGKELKYNIYEKEWQYAYPDAELKYNIYERRWEY